MADCVSWLPRFVCLLRALCGQSSMENHISFVSRLRPMVLRKVGANHLGQYPYAKNVRFKSRPSA
jgi:hypothetical protein